MSCIILSANGKTYRITKDTGIMDSFFTEEIDLSISSDVNEIFIQNLFQDIPMSGYKIQEWENNSWQNSDLNIADFRQVLNQALIDDPSKTLYGYDGDIVEASIKDVAEHVQGNRQLGEGYGYNFLHNSAMGSNSFYIFTEKRGVVISGIGASRTHSYWFKIYEELKAEQSSKTRTKPITTLINRLYNKEDSSSIYDKLTAVINGNSEALIHAIGNRYISNKHRFAENITATTRKSLIGKESELFAGDIVSIDNTVYMIPSHAKVKGHDDQIYLINTETNQKEIVEIRNITSPLYIPIKVTIDDHEYYLLKNKWFELKKGKFYKVETVKTLESIYTFLNSPNPNTIVLSGKPTLYSLEYGVIDKDGTLTAKKLWCDSVIKLLPLGTKIECAGDEFTKTEEGWFNSSEEKLTGNTVIDVITLPQDVDTEVVTLIKQKLIPLRSKYTKSDIEYMLDQHYSDIASYQDTDGENTIIYPTFTYQYRERFPVTIKYNETNKGILEPSLVINTNPNIVVDPLFLQEVVSACEFIKRLQSDLEFKNSIDERISKTKTLSLQKVYNEIRAEQSSDEWDTISKIEEELVLSLESKTDISPREEHYEEAAKLIAQLKKLGGDNYGEMCEI